MIEQSAYEHRQQVLKDLELIKSKERDIERIKNHELDKIKLEREKVQSLEKECMKMKLELDQKNKEQELLINKEIQQFKKEWELEHESISKSIKQDNLEIKREKHNLQMELEKIDDYKIEIRQLKDELKSYKEN